jgi:ATP-binding cassette, subfamily F, member 3
MNNLTLTIGGKILLEGTTLKLVSGRKYGLIGRNGIGKTTLLNQIVKRDIDFPKDIHVLHVEQEIDPDENEVLWSVVSCDVERINLMEEEHRLLSKDPAITEKKKKREIDQTQRINQIHERLVDLYFYSI